MILNIILLLTAIAAAAMAFAAWQRVASLRAENARLTERLTQLENDAPERRRADEDRFRLLARETLEQNAAMFRNASNEHLGRMLEPLRHDIETFSRNVTECYNSEARERFSLKERIRELIELNNTIGRETRDLTTALKGSNKVQGDWGEVVLESILEKSGLRRGEQYFVQEASLTTEDGSRLRPDVIVRYPGGRSVVIDSKVSLTAFMELVGADSPEAEKRWGQRLVQSVRNHITELRRKSYQDVMGDSAPDFVMMFIPNEPAYIAAMRLEPRLWQDAYDDHVLLVSPTHLISVLRLVEQLWRQDKQSRNAAEIAERAGQMLDKFTGFMKDMDDVAAALDRAERAHAKAMNKLLTGRGSLVSAARRLQAMGAKTSKPLPGLAADDSLPLSESNEEAGDGLVD